MHRKTEYNLTDQTSTTLSSGLGNVRVVFAAHVNGQPEVMQQTSYYPFGYTLQQNDYYASVTSENKNLYNGKELQDDVLAGSRLDWYDYGARMYEAALGRFSCIDPIADQFAHVSPYNYAENRPIDCIDLWGLQALQVSAGARGAVPLLGPWGISANFEMGVILDINYDLLLYGTAGFGGSCGGALSVGLNATFYPTANNYKDLVGLGADLGVSTPYFLSGQGNVSFSDNGPKRGGTLSYGFPTLTAGSAAYADVTFTYLLSEPINIREVNSSALNQISQMMGISMQQARIILALMKTKIEKEEEKKWAENSVMLEGVEITAKRLDKTQTNNNRLQSKNTKSGFISPFQQGRTIPGDPGYQGSYWQAYDDAKNF